MSADYDVMVAEVTKFPDADNDALHFPLPTKCRYWTYYDQDDWVVRVAVDAPCVATGEPGVFRTVWRGRRPDTARGELEIISQTIEAALKHEVREQLGLDPHSRTPYGHGCTDGRHVAGCACRTEGT